MWKYVLIANNELKCFYRWDELSDAIQAYQYTKQFYNDATLNVMKYSETGHTIVLVKCDLEKGNKYVFSSSGQ